jgi:hypothetical protein
MSPPVTAADITFMDSAKIAALVAAGIAELVARDELHLLDKAQAERLGGDE